MTLRAAALALALAALPAWALDAAPRLDGAALALERGGVSTRLTLTADGALRLTSTATGAAVGKLPFSLELPKGKALTQAGDTFTAGAYTLTAAADGTVSLSAAGKRLLTLTLERGEGSALQARLQFDGARTFHGMGQAAPALALRSERFELVHTPKYGDQTYLYIPFFFTDSGLAVYANAASGDFVSFKQGSLATLSSDSGQLDFYLWGPESPQALVARFYRASGVDSLLPLWAYGYIQSRYGYRTDDEVRRVVTMAARQGIPMSAIVLDLYWFKRMGDLDWNREAFPDPKGLADWLEQQGVKLITISEPFIARDSKSFAELDAAQALAKQADGGTIIFSDWWDFGKAGGSIIDPATPATAGLLSAKYEAMTRVGVDGFWIDLGEPERTPAAARFGPYSEAAYHDFFNLFWARIVRQSVEKAAPGRRPFILSRSGWTGIAGLGVSTWSGDVPCSWEGLQAQVPLGLNASLSGLPYWGSDVMGFTGEGGELMPPDPELSLRWHQFGAFTPVYRAHGFGPREPWIYGPQWQVHLKRAITLRAALVPYVYSTAWQVRAQGLPMMRPLFFLEPSVAALRDEDSMFLLGDSILVAPVLKAMASEAKKTVRLPPGGWYDAFTLERLEGGRALELPVTLDTFPVYYREGAIVPMLPEGDEALLLLPGAAPTSFTVFSDDGVSEAYRSGAGEKLVVQLDAKGVTFSGAVKARTLRLRFPPQLKLPTLQKQATVERGAQQVKVNLKVGTTRVIF